jgi:hypothetical protein
VTQGRSCPAHTIADASACHTGSLLLLLLLLLPPLPLHPQVEEAVRARLTVEKEALLLRAANENYSQQVRVMHAGTRQSGPILYMLLSKRSLLTCFFSHFLENSVTLESCKHLIFCPCVVLCCCRGRRWRR